MRSTIKIALVGIALAGGSLTAGLPAKADTTTIGISEGGIAFGYSDGYWDRGHQWHTWRDQNEATSWRDQNHDHYFDRKHDVDHDQGWRDNDHWWDRH
jgi:hypothetical protein